MCLLAILYRTVNDAPLLVAANREEFYNRPFLPPHVQGEGPRFLAGIDERAGGTWLGVNENGVVAAVTNRPKSSIPEQLRSRGLLCRELLEHTSAGDAAEYAARQLATGHYAGANFVVADGQSGWIIEAADEIRQTELTAGLQLVTNGVPNDQRDPRQELVREMFAARPIDGLESFLDVARHVCRQGPDASGRRVVLRFLERGTVSSTLLAVTANPASAVCQFAPGPPDVTPYDDYSRELRELLRR
jgi:uncharacterized protein with NRDE domain